MGFVRLGVEEKENWRKRRTNANEMNSWKWKTIGFKKEERKREPRHVRRAYFLFLFLIFFFPMRIRMVENSMESCGSRLVAGPLRHVAWACPVSPLFITLRVFLFFHFGDSLLLAESRSRPSYSHFIHRPTSHILLSITRWCINF